jgi:hypothetical protein
LQANEADARLANAIKHYEAEKLKKNSTPIPNMENQTENDISSDSNVNIMESSLTTNPPNTNFVPKENTYRPPS